jgi:hypothetical protein
MKKILKRRVSGFVDYPWEYHERRVDGTARYRTRCDMIVGPCACGAVHQEDDPWVRDLLTYYEVEFEIFVLRLSCYREVKFPRYWVRPPRHKECTMLVGPCACGKHHTGKEDWVSRLLRQHKAAIEGVNEPRDYYYLDAPSGRALNRSQL